MNIGGTGPENVDGGAHWEQREYLSTCSIEPPEKETLHTVHESSNSLLIQWMNYGLQRSFRCSGQLRKEVIQNRADRQTLDALCSSDVTEQYSHDNTVLNGSND